MAKFRHPLRDMGGNWGQGGHWIRTEKRHRIYQRDNFCCVWCGDRVGVGQDASLDHVIPRAGGGSNAANNLVTACITCNAQRGEEPAFLWIMRRWGLQAGVLVLERLVNAMAGSLPAPSKARQARPTRTKASTA